MACNFPEVRFYPNNQFFVTIDNFLTRTPPHSHPFFLNHRYGPMAEIAITASATG